MGTLTVRLYLLLMQSLYPLQQQSPPFLESSRITTSQNLHLHDLPGPVRFIAAGPLELQGTHVSVEGKKH